MLFILTGDIQIGKTRWLQALCGELGGRGVPVAGVLAPGVWRVDASRPGGFEKLGIDNVLLPAGERLPFARRRDIVQAGGDARGSHAQGLAGCSQSEGEKLTWAIRDDMIAIVNRHFDELEREAQAPAACPAGLFVVDELGRLEFERGAGLTSAMRLLKAGPTSAWPHAVVVVRDWLVPRAHTFLDAAWPDGVREIGPTDDARELLLGLFS